MHLLILGLVLFLGVHSVRIVADGWRSRFLARAGAARWKLSYTALSLVGFILIVVGYGQARMAPVALWATPAWAPHAAALLMLISLLLLSATYVPQSHLRLAVRHPMVCSVLVFALAHLLANNTVADVLLFGSFLLWAFVDLLSCLARDKRNGTLYPQPRAVHTVLNLAIGLIAWGAIAFWLHRLVIGVAPFALR